MLNELFGMVDELRGRIVSYGFCNPFLTFVTVLEESDLVEVVVELFVGEWVGRNFEFKCPVVVSVVLFRRDGVTSLEFGGVTCLRVVALFNVFVECELVSDGSVEHFYILNDVYRVDLEVN